MRRLPPPTGQRRQRSFCPRLIKHCPERRICHEDLLIGEHQKRAWGSPQGPPTVAPVVTSRHELLASSTRSRGRIVSTDRAGRTTGRSDLPHRPARVKHSLVAKHQERETGT